jgi:hypothetical protein
MTHTSTLFVAISSLFVCSAGNAQSAVDIGVFAGADTLHVTENLPGYDAQTHDITSPGQSIPCIKSFPLKRESGGARHSTHPYSDGESSSGRGGIP